MDFLVLNGNLLELELDLIFWGHLDQDWIFGTFKTYTESFGDNSDLDLMLWGHLELDWMFEDLLGLEEIF